MQKKYTKKQLLEAIAYWKDQLRKMNEAEEYNFAEIGEFAIARDGAVASTAELEPFAAEDLTVKTDPTSGVETFVFDNEAEANDVCADLNRTLMRSEVPYEVVDTKTLDLA